MELLKLPHNIVALIGLLGFSIQKGVVDNCVEHFFQFNCTLLLRFAALFTTNGSPTLKIQRVAQNLNFQDFITISLK